MIIVDASAVLAILLREPNWEAVAALLDPTNLVSAESLPLEIGNSLSSLVRRNLLADEMAQKIWSAYTSLPVRLLEIPYLMALDLAFAHKIYAYDAYILAVAMQHRSQLLTLDKEMACVAKSLGITVKGV